MAVSKRLRHEVMRRDNHTCKYCGATAPDVRLTIDHVTPVSLGGQDVPENLVTACADCNAGKSATPPDAALVADVDRKAVEWAHAMRLAIEHRSAELAEERGRTDRFDQEWRRWNAGGEEVWRDQNWRASVLRLLAAGLTDEFLVDAVGIAMRSKVKSSDTWKYFCGVCWREVGKLQAAARQIVATARPASEADDADDADEFFKKRNPMDPIRVCPGGDEMNAESKFSLGAHPLFPSIEMAERYVQRLVEALGGDRYLVSEAGNVLWDVMEHGYRAFMADDVDWAGSADERVAKAVDEAMAVFILKVKLAQPTWEPSNGS